MIIKSNTLRTQKWLERLQTRLHGPQATKDYHNPRRTTTRRTAPVAITDGTRPRADDGASSSSGDASSSDDSSSSGDASSSDDASSSATSSSSSSGSRFSEATVVVPQHLGSHHSEIKYSMTSTPISRPAGLTKNDAASPQV